MKGKRSKLLLVLALVVVSALCLYTACNKNGDNGKTEVTITLGEKTEYELDLYEQVTLKATVTGTDEAVQWKTSDATVATVENGTVTALKAGTATITATVAEKSATCSVKVTPSGAVPMIVGVNSSVTLKYGTNTKVTPQAEYKGNAIDVTFTYESENPEIATVENGTITAVKVGTTTVYVRATYYNYNMEEEIAVTVRDDVSMSLDVSELTLAISEPTADFHKTHQLTADITENGQPVTDMSKVTYKSSDDTSVTVSEEGLVTALKIPESGSVTVTASYTSTNNDKFDAFVIVTVIKPEVAVVPDSAIVAEINADTEENMELSLAALGEYGVTADKVTAITDVAKNAVVEFTASEGKLMLKKSTVWSGEREFRVETADASFKLPVTMITKILNTAADLDKMSDYSKADLSSNVSAYQWGGYFVLGADIDYGGKTFTSWCGYSQWSDTSTDTTARGFTGVIDGQNHTISNMVISGSNAGFIGMLNQSGVIRNIAFANTKVSGNAGLICLVGGTIENVIVHGSRSSDSNDSWGRSGLLIGKILNASAVLKNVLVLHEGTPSANDGVIYGTGDNKPYTLSDVYGVCVGKQDLCLSVGGGQLNRALGTTTIMALAANKNADLSGFTGWDTSLGVPLTQDIIDVISDSLLYEVYIEEEGFLFAGENQLTANKDGVTWSLKEAYEFVTVDAETGLVTVGEKAENNKQVTVVATLGDYTFERTFTLVVAVREDRTSNISAYWDKTSSEAYTVTLDELKTFGGTFEGVYDEEYKKYESEYADGTITLAESASTALKAESAGERVFLIRMKKDNNLYDYAVKVVLATKILMTATDLDQMSALSAADPASNVSAYQWGGYFVLGADIDYGGKTFASWCGYSQWSDGSVDTSARGFIGVFDGRNYTISNLSVSGSNAGFIGMLNEKGVVRNVAFANVKVSGNAGLICLIGGTVENVIIHGSRSSASNDSWGISGILAGKVLNANAVLKNILILHEGNPSANDYVVFGTGDNKAYTMTDVYGVCVSKQDLYKSVGGGNLTRVLAKSTIETLLADDTVNFDGFSGWDMSMGVPMSEKVMNAISDSLLYEFYIVNDGFLMVGENELSANKDGAAWSLKAAVEGVAIDAETGVLTVAESVENNTEVTVVATLEGKTFERTFTIVVAKREDRTSNISAYWDKTASAYSVTLDELKSFEGTFVGLYDTNYNKLGSSYSNGTVTLSAEAVTSVQAEKVGDYVYFIRMQKNNDLYDYAVKVALVTKILMTAADIDQMSALSAADSTSNVAAYQWGGYFVLGADINYGGKTYTSWCGYSQSGGSTDTTTRGFMGVFDGRNYTVSNLTISGSNNGFIGMLHQDGIVRNVAFVNLTISENASFVCVAGGTVENVIVHGVKNGTSATWGVSGLLIGKIVNAKCVVKNCLVLVENTPSTVDAVIYGTGDDKAYTITDVYGVCVGNQTVTQRLGSGILTRVLAKSTVETLLADETVNFDGFSGWNMSMGVPMSEKVMNAVSDSLLYEFYIENKGLLTEGETQLTANKEGATWSLKEEVAGVTIDEATGKITVGADAENDKQVTVVATLGEEVFERTFTLLVTTVEDRTASVSAYWDKTSSEAYTVTLEELKTFGGTFVGFYDTAYNKYESTYSDGTVTLGADVSATFRTQGAADYTYIIRMQKEGKTYDYQIKIALVSKILMTAADLDQMSALSAKEPMSSQYVFYGYFVLGANIDYGGKEYTTWCGINQCGSSLDTTAYGFTGIFDGRNYTISNLCVSGSNAGFIGMLNEKGVVRNVAFANVKVSGNAGLICLVGGTIENVIIHGSRSTASNDSWGRSGILSGKILNAKAVLKNILILHEGEPSANDYVIFGTGDNKAYTMTDVYGVCATKQDICVSVGGGTLTRVIVKDTVDNLIADENVQLGGFSGWDMTKGIPLSQPIIDILYPAAAE